MCGIILLSGPNAATRLSGCMRRIRHRGPDDQAAWIEGDVALGFTRLAINGDRAAGRQPHQHGEQVGAINGEIYNFRALAKTHGLRPAECDTLVVLPLLERLGHRVIDELDGFYSAVVLRRATREAICLRDHIGKKPLLVGRSRRELFITSELKALDECDWFAPLPRGVSMINLDSGVVTHVADHRPLARQRDLHRLFELAVRKRVPGPNQPVGAFLSGGLDSSLLAMALSRIRRDAVYFTLGDANGPDHQAAATVASALGLRDVRSVPLPTPAQLPALIRSVVYATESFNPSIVSNGLATYLLARAAREAGIKVVLTGEGADELFGGYHRFRKDDPWFEVRRRLIEDMHMTELRRLDMSCMAHSVEPRCPFLDRALRRYSDDLSYEDLYEGDANKVALRRCFEGALPPEILHRRKTSFDVGSGIRGLVVRHLRRRGRSEREELERVWKRCFAYDAAAPFFHAYPVFDTAIDRRSDTHR